MRVATCSERERSAHLHHSGRSGELHHMSTISVPSAPVATTQDAAKKTDCRRGRAWLLLGRPAGARDRRGSGREPPARSRRSATSSTIRRSSSACARGRRGRGIGRARLQTRGFTRVAITAHGWVRTWRCKRRSADAADRHDLPVGHQGAAAGAEAGPPGLLSGRLWRLLPPGGAKRDRLGRHIKVGRRQEDRRPALERAARRQRRGRRHAAAQGGASSPRRPRTSTS